jgi:hypothetical protein
VPFPAHNIEGAVPFPVDVLPSALRNAVVALAHFIQVDESLPAQDGLGIFSSTIARRVVVLEGDWWEETNLWELGCAASGERKSATLRKLMEPVREVERERRESEQQQIAGETATAELLQQEYQQAVKKAGRQEHEADRIAAEIEARELARRIGEQEAGRTSPTRLVVDDVTPEYLGRGWRRTTRCCSLAPREGYSTTSSTATPTSRTSTC